ncbi:hypothetical protein BGZ65_001074 [Modicella reniformis]|uniref:Uncharacterized protein n=1 Tax=Modicella reniformis TaxID=1440133 RepID=A0A9P6J700_9FUNG|nr:hypothetical protein BGZ65_001074 [Modicella reniformis]
MDSDISGYDLTLDHPGYHLPVSNIAYHTYPEENSTDTEAVAQRAFQRIMDSYDKYEKLTDVFQVELDKRQQLVKERKEREKLLREERQRQMKEEKKNKRFSKIHHHPGNSNSNSIGSSKTGAPAAFLLPSKVLWHPYHPCSRVGSLSSLQDASITNLGRGPSTAGRHSLGQSHGSTSGAVASGSQSLPLQDHPPHLVHGASFAGERSLSNSPVLPLTPSPQLRATSESAVGLDLSTAAGTSGGRGYDSATAASRSRSSSTTTPFSLCESMSSFHGVQQQSFRLRKKRKQTIPVHPSVVDRIPGITLRIQPDTEQQLQVEILKNVDDYQTQPIASKSAEETGATPDTSNGVEPRSGIVSEGQDESNDDSSSSRSELQQQIQAKQDMEKVLESIESCRPGYSFLPAAYLHQALEKELQNCESMGVYDSATDSRRLPHQKHRRQSSSGSGRSLEPYDPIGIRLLSTSATSLTLAEHQPLELVGSRVLLEEAVAARAKLPLTWDNFSTRDCQVNKVKVVGKRDEDFEMLEEAVQEVIARQHRAQTPSEDSDSASNHHNQTSEKGPSRRSSHYQPDREETIASTSTAQVSSLSKPAVTRAATKKISIPTPSTITPSRLVGTRTTRGGAKELVQGFDDIERILKEKRLKKRAEKQHQGSVSRASSQAAGDGDHEYDQEDDYPMPLHRGQEEENEHESGDEKGNRRTMSRRSRKAFNAALTLEKGSMSMPLPGSPLSPPHSRQVTPSKGEAAGISRRSSLASSRPQPFSFTATGPGSDTSSTPPATPTRATAPLPPLFGSSESAGQSSGGRRRTRSRSTSNTVHPEGKNVFFDFALEKIDKKRKEHIAKKRAAAAAATAAVAVSMQPTTVETGPDRQDTKPEAKAEVGVKSEMETLVKTESQETETMAETAVAQGNQLDKNSAALEDLLTINFDLTPTSAFASGLERELDSLTSSKPSESANANLPKSSKFLPGRVLRKGRTKESDHDSSEHTTSGEDLDLYDLDCTSCRLALDSFDKLLWKQAQQAGEVHLNPKRWGKTAILCIACRVQFQRHHLRCTQCFYVPVIAEDVVGRSGAPKAGGTCSRCKAGTWLREN